MSLHPTDWHEIPPETAELGRKLLAENHPYRLLGDRLSDLIHDEDFADLYTPIGGPAISPVILSLILVFQMLEKLPDRLAAEALKVRIDWKYALHLPLDYPGFYFTNLNHFRERLLQHQAEYRVFDRLIQKLVELGFIRRKGKQRTDSTHILGLVAKLSRLELVRETLRVALEALKQQDESWLTQQVPESYLQEYLERHMDYRLTEQEMQSALRRTGADGWWLLQKLAQAAQRLQELSEIQVMRIVWEQQFDVDQDNHYQGPRKQVDPKELIQSPHDPEVRYSEKHGKGWTGYRAQVTETAEPKGCVNFLTDVAVTHAQLQDVKALPQIRTRLAERYLTPSEQYVDQAYMSTQQLADSAEQGIRLMGPMPSTPRPALYQVSDFKIDQEQRIATCPAGKPSERGTLSKRADGTSEYVFFFGQQCNLCPLRQRCTSAKDGRTLRYHIYHRYLEARQMEMQSEAFWKALQARRPIEGTISQLVRQGARQARYRGQAKVHLQWIFVAIAVNLKRLWRAWASGYQPNWALLSTE
jgi:transposase